VDGRGLGARGGFWRSPHPHPHTPEAEWGKLRLSNLCFSSWASSGGEAALGMLCTGGRGGVCLSPRTFLHNRREGDIGQCRPSVIHRNFGTGRCLQVHCTWLIPSFPSGPHPSPCLLGEQRAWGPSVRWWQERWSFLPGMGTRWERRTSCQLQRALIFPNKSHTPPVIQTHPTWPDSCRAESALGAGRPQSSPEHWPYPDYPLRLPANQNSATCWWHLCFLWRPLPF
jgi:hypothetical protein